MLSSFTVPFTPAGFTGREGGRACCRSQPAEAFSATKRLPAELRYRSLDLLMTTLPLIHHDSPLFRRWEKASYRLIDVGGYYQGRISGLGRLDSFLRDEDEARRRDFRESGIPNGHALDDFLLLSQLWVFGVYEMLRTLDEQLRADPRPWSPVDCGAVTAMKQKYERIRVPLAKLEPARRFKASDEVPIGACVLGKHEQKGWCWKIGPDKYIWRIDLAEELLAMVEALPLPVVLQKIRAEQ